MKLSRTLLGVGAFLIFGSPAMADLWQNPASGIIDLVSSTNTVVIQSTLTVQGQDSSGYSLSLSSGIYMPVGAVNAWNVWTSSVTTSPSGSLPLYIYSGSGGGAGGNLNLTAGNSLFNGGTGGSINLKAGRPSGGGYNGGSINLTAGSGDATVGGGGTSGDVVLTAGSTSSGFSGGSTILAAGTGSPNGIINFKTSGLDRMAIFSNGNVGIGGIPSPATKFEVNGDAQFGAAPTKSTFTSSGNLQLVSGSTLTFNGTLSLSTAASASLTGIPAVFINGSGQVGINTTTPGTVLDVNGATTIRAQETVTSTLTVQGNAFSVGGSTLVVSAGTTTVNGNFIVTSSTGIWMSGATYVKVTQSVDTTLPGGNGTFIYTKIKFDTVTKDVLGEFSTTQSSFTAQTAGYYEIIATCYLYNSIVGGTQYHIALYKNNAGTDELAYISPNTSGINLNVNDILYLNSGDWIQIFIGNVAASSAACYSPLSYLTIRKMP